MLAAPSLLLLRTTRDPWERVCRVSSSEWRLAGSGGLRLQCLVTVALCRRCSLESGGWQCIPFSSLFLSIFPFNRLCKKVTDKMKPEGINRALSGPDPHLNYFVALCFDDEWPHLESQASRGISAVGLTALSDHHWGGKNCNTHCSVLCSASWLSRERSPWLLKTVDSPVSVL